MGKHGFIGQLQEDKTDGMSAASGYEEGSEEEEPYECEFYDDDDDEPQDVEHCDGTALPEDGDASDDEPYEMELCSDEGSGKCGSSHRESYTNPVPDGHHICRKRLYEDEFVEKKSSYVQPLKQEENKKEPRQILKHSNSVQEEVSVAKEKETIPFKKRLSVKFAADVSCYTYSTESFAAATIEKRKAQSDDQDKHLCKRQEHSFSSPNDGGNLKEGDDTNLFVGSLPLSMTSHKLIELFLPFGRIVRSRVVDDCLTGLSKGYGFVKYSDPQCAAEAIKCMNGRMVEGKILEVRVAEPSASNPSVHAVPETDHQPTKQMDKSNIYVHNLPLLMNTDKLIDLFAPYGQVTSAKVAMDYTSGISKGYGFVKFSDPHDAANAVRQLHGRLLEGRNIEVRVSGMSLRPSSSPVESHADNRPLKEIDMSNLYVCNIPSSVNTAKLVELFLPFGKITHARLVEQGKNSSKGCGFIKFADSHCAAEAVTLMNGALIEGETIMVRVAGLSPSVPSSVSQHTSQPVTNLSPEINKCRLYVTNLPQSMTADKFVSLFTPFGQIDRVVMMVEYSFVLYADVNSAAKALKHMDGYLIEGKNLVVKGSEHCPVNAVDPACSQSGSKLIKEIDMSNLYVGRVPSAVTYDQLVQLFCPYGEIVQAKKYDATGYGMIRYANASSAAAAIEHLDGYQIGGNSLIVRVAGLPAESDVTTNAHKQIDMTNLYVCHLPPYVTTEKLIELFMSCGQITQAKVVVDKFTGVSKGFGFVKFADAYSAAVAITHMNGYPLDGHVLSVRIANVHLSDMASYMAHFYSYFTSPDPSRMAVGIPTSQWPYYYGESAYTPYYYGEYAHTPYYYGGSAYTTPTVYQGQGTDSATAAHQTSQLEGLPGSELAGSSSVSNSVASDPSRLEGRTGPPGFESHAAVKKYATVSVWTGPPGFEPDAVTNTKKDATVWNGPPGFEPDADTKKDNTVMNPPQACSKVRLSHSGGSQKGSSVV
jgi:polyadenylate-binding protein